MERNYTIMVTPNAKETMTFLVLEPSV